MQVWPDLNEVVPAIELEAIAQQVLTQSPTMAMWSGGAVVALGLIVRTVINWYQADRANADFEWKKPIIIAAIYLAAIGSYKYVVILPIAWFSQMGNAVASTATIDQQFTKRRIALETYRRTSSERSRTPWRTAEEYKQAMHEALSAPMSEDGFAFTVLWLATTFSYVAVHWAIAFIQTLQLFILAALISYGPFMLALGSLGGPFAHLGPTWIWVIVEVSAWSLTQAMLLATFGNHLPPLPETPVYTQEIILCLILVGLMASTMIFTAKLLGQASTAALGQTVVAGAAGGASMASRGVQGAVPAAAMRQAVSTVAQGMGGAGNTWMAQKIDNISGGSKGS